MGAVGDLRRIKDAIAVARAVMKYTKHTMIVGDAGRFSPYPTLIVLKQVWIVVQ